MEELKSYYGPEVVSIDEAAKAATAARNIPSVRSVSHLPIPPPEWCRLPRDKDLPSIPFQGGRNLPTKFDLDSNSWCSCGETTISDDVTVSNLIIYTSFMILNADIQTSYCISCSNTKGRIGPDLGVHGLFNWNNKIAFSHELMNSYTSQFTTSETPLYGFYQTVVHTYKNEGYATGAFCSERTFNSAWFAFASLQHIASNMQCSQCGPNPEVVIADGVSVSFPKHRVETLQPPTMSDKTGALVRLPRKAIKATCFVGPYKLRTAIRKALDDEDLNAGKQKLIIILEAEVTNSH
jgi:hypothetical protein